MKLRWTPESGSIEKHWYAVMVLSQSLSSFKVYCLSITEGKRASYRYGSVHLGTWKWKTGQKKLSQKKNGEKKEYRVLNTGCFGIMVSSDCTLLLDEEYN